MRKSTFKFSALLLFMAMGTLLMGQTQFNVTFTVDMNEADPFDPVTDEVYISGTLSGWAQPGSDITYRMEPTTEDPLVYSITLLADSGQVAYKYFRVIDGVASWDNGEWGGDPNRITLLLMEDQTVVNTWGNMPYWVTFEVDMTPADPFDPETDEVFITGDFAGWTMPGTIPELAFAPIEDASMIYTTQVLLYPGSYQYKYFRVIDQTPSWDNGEWAGDPNRQFTVDTTMIIEDVWGDINAGIFDTKTEFTYDMYPNPVVNNLTIAGIEGVNRIEIFDVSGRMVESVKVTSERVSINLSDLQSGVYIISLYNEAGVQTTKFIKN